ncbi:MAG: TetR/AcrR family transcriptional regulator [bacterium]
MCSDLNDKILDTAGEMFMNFGLRSVSIDDICNELHISKKTFYVHFNNKEQLIFHLLERIGKYEEENFSQLLLMGNVIEAIAKRAKSLINKGDIDKYMVFYFDLKKYYPELHHKHDAYVNEHNRNNFKKLIVEGKNQNLFRSEINEHHMSYVLNGLILDFYNRFADTGMTNKQKIDMIIDLVLRLLATDEARDNWNNRNNVKK